MEQLRVLLVTTNPSYKNIVKGICSQLELAITTIDSRWEEQNLEIYTFLLFDQKSLKGSDIEKLKKHQTIILIAEPIFHKTRFWLQGGALDVILLPDESERLQSVLVEKRFQRKDDTNSTSSMEGKGSGYVTAFFSAKGGSGTTLLSTMYAQLLQKKRNQRTILIDLNGQFGGVEVLFGQQPQRSYADLQPVLSELNLTHIRNIAWQDEQTGLTILFSPTHAEQAEQITDELLTRVIQTCSDHYDQVVLDLPSVLNSFTLVGLYQALNIYYIMTPDALAIRACKYAMDTFDRLQIKGYASIEVIVNRLHPKSDLSMKDIEKLVQLPVVGGVKSNYFSLQPYINMGQPFIDKKKKSQGNRVLRDMERIVGRAFKR